MIFLFGLLRFCGTTGTVSKIHFKNLFVKYKLRCLLPSLEFFFLWLMPAGGKNDHNVYAKFRFDICTKSLSAMPRGVGKSANLETVLTETQG